MVLPKLDLKQLQEGDLVIFDNLDMAIVRLTKNFRSPSEFIPEKRLTTATLEFTHSVYMPNGVVCKCAIVKACSENYNTYRNLSGYPISDLEY